MKINKQTLIRWKIYFDRARMYIGYFQFVMLVIIFINSIKTNKYGKYLVEYSEISIPLLIILFIGGSLLLGYLDSRLGIRSEEMRNLSYHNPVQREMLDALNEIKQELKKKPGSGS
ncbi:MAG: hypothetical protein JXB00_12020 [Bacteroidales bacterium]|nr:hypothetical protein [Bacteroidales bacterium]